jgi:GT2 family glycosyltransferase
MAIVRDNGTGLYAALNQGWRVPGEWDAFTWLNDDDLLLAPGFGGLLEALSRRPEVDVAYGRVRLIGAKGEILGSHPVARRGSDLKALLVRGIMSLAQPGTVIRRSLIERLGGFDETFRSAGDLDFFTRALAAGARFEFFNARVADFRLHAGQLSKRRAEVEAETARALRPLAGTPRSLAALMRFRLGNAGVYGDRVRRHGFRSMRELYDQSE